MVKKPKTAAPAPLPQLPAEKSPKTPPVQHIRDYWPRFYRFALLTTILMQVIVALVAGLALILSGMSISSMEFALTLLATSAAAIGINILLLGIVTQPLKDISAAITHSSGEPTNVIPPNPNARSYARDGFKQLLQFVYDRAAHYDDKTHPHDDTLALLGTALAQTTVGFIILDSSGHVVYANKQAPVRVDSNGTKHMTLLFDNDAPLEQWLTSSRKRQVRANRSWLRVPDSIPGTDGRRIFDVVASYEKESQAETVLLCFDRTELYKPEDDQLEFISFAAHELRGPITVIRGYIDVLQQELDRTPANAEKHLLLDRLTVSANRLSGYINNILNASRYDQRHLKVNLSEQTITKIYDSIKDDMQLRASAQGRVLAVEFPAGLPTIAADPSSLSEVFSNLIDNAIKYSNPAGVVTIAATQEGEFVRVDIIDRGIGIPANVVRNLFHKFYRSHRSRETVAGTGIGLYISKGIVESHGGHVEVKSEVGQGSTFSFTVPTYASVAEKLKTSDNSNEQLIRSGNDGWIRNHAKYRG